MTTGRGKGRTPNLTKNTQSRHRVLPYSSATVPGTGRTRWACRIVEVKLNNKCGATLSGRGYLLARFLRKTLRRSPITVPFVPANFR